MKSIIIFTSPTSATTSLRRIVKTIVDTRLIHRPYYDETVKNLSKNDLKSYFPPEDGYCLFHNQPSRFNTNLDLDSYRFIVNFRDPRDRICNEYFWQFSHPNTVETPEQTEARRRKIRELGIDNWIIERLRTQNARDYYNSLIWVLDNAPESVAATYAQLCCGFDGFIERISNFTGAPLTEKVLKALKPERPENIEAHPKWIGGKWAGSDTMPGRYKRELMPETIKKMNVYFEPVLKDMARHDPEFSHQYLEGVDLSEASDNGFGKEESDGLEIRVGDITFRTHLLIEDAELVRLIKLARQTIA